MSDAPVPVSVLFVDDEALILQTIQRILRSSDLEVLTAPGAREAMALLDTRRVDVLVTDIDMPEMDGLELIAWVRKQHPTTVRMVLSGAGTLERALEAINVGEVHRFFAKPFDARAFRAALESLAERIQRLRQDGEDRARASRREMLVRWVEERHPGIGAIARDPDGTVVVDPHVLDDADFLAPPHAATDPSVTDQLAARGTDAEPSAGDRSAGDPPAADPPAANPSAADQSSSS